MMNSFKAVPSGKHILQLFHELFSLSTSWVLNVFEYWFEGTLILHHSLLYKKRSLKRFLADTAPGTGACCQRSQAIFLTCCLPRKGNSQLLSKNATSNTFHWDSCWRKGLCTLQHSLAQVGDSVGHPPRPIRYRPDGIMNMINLGHSLWNLNLDRCQRKTGEKNMLSLKLLIPRSWFYSNSHSFFFFLPWFLAFPQFCELFT